ncbi:MAG TPA: ABC transporter permease [Gaiellaceae bacterium]|nr:ABC transporter permease [Gaiellaceae bacterium]
MATRATSQPPVGAFRRRIALSRVPPVFLTLSWIVVGVVLFLAIFGSWLEPYPPQEQDLLAASQPPSPEHWLGTDGLGRDILSRMIAGADSAVIGPLIVAFTGMLAGSALGIASGYLGGTTDMVIQRLVDFMFALPGLLIAIVIVGVVGGGYGLAVLVLSILNVAGGVRLLRGAALEQRSLPYVEAARTLGVPRWRIMYLHIWRNISPIVFANAALDFALALVALSSLSYLGLGTQPGVPEWGRMLSENQSLLFQNPAGVLAPALAIVLVATSVTIIGDWIYDRFSYSGRTGR